MKTLPGKDEVVDSAVDLVVDLIAEEKDLKGILTLQIRREPIGREVASTGEEEEDVEAEVVVVEEEAVVVLARAVAVEVVVVVASGGSESSKEEVAAIARKSFFFKITFRNKYDVFTSVPGGLSLQKFKTWLTSYLPCIHFTNV